MACTVRWYQPDHALSVDGQLSVAPPSTLWQETRLHTCPLPKQHKVGILGIGSFYSCPFGHHGCSLGNCAAPDQCGNVSRVAALPCPALHCTCRFQGAPSLKKNPCVAIRLVDHHNQDGDSTGQPLCLLEPPYFPQLLPPWFGLGEHAVHGHGLRRQWLFRKSKQCHPNQSKRSDGATVKSTYSVQCIL